MAKIEDLQEGAHVSWKTGRQRVTGEILRKAVCRLCLGARNIDASPSDPRFIVRDEAGALGAYRATDLQLVC